MKLKFTKMHGCGNDYIYINCFEQKVDNPNELSIKLSDRHFGIGADGIILICPSDTSDAKMRMFNLDGSEGKMCGNGIRCVGKFLDDKGITHGDEITVETLSGVKTLALFRENGEVSSVRVNMGKAELDAEKIPVKLKSGKIINEAFKLGDKEYRINCVSMGNPHCVVFGCDTDSLDIEKIGPLFEKNSIFPEGVNTEFVEVLDRNVLKMRVWERGSGETLACGTGACACAVAAVENGLCEKNCDILVKLLGGDLVINYTDEAVYLKGAAVRVFDGEINI